MSESTADATTPAPEKTAASRRLWYAWQALTMPLFYPAFGLACLLMLVLTGYAQLRYRAPASRTRWLRRQVQRIARTWLAWGSSLQLLQHDIDHRDPLAAQGPARVIVANHPSLVDVIFVLAEVPNVCCVLKAELGHIPVLGMLVRKLDYLSNDDPERLLAAGSARLHSGESLLIFPEGTRTKLAPRMQFRLGAAELALRTGAAVLPIVIHYHGRYLSGLGRWYEFPEQQLHYTIEIGPERPTPAAPTTAARRAQRRPFNRALETRFDERLALGPRPHRREARSARRAHAAQITAPTTASAHAHSENTL